MKPFSKTLTLSAAGTLLLCSAWLPVPARADDKDLPPGPAKEVIMKVCTACHDLDRVTSERHTKTEWSDIVFTMKDNGADGTPEELDDIINYLAANFSKDQKVNVNKAEPADLARVLMLTQKEAQALVDYRKAHGDFKTLDDLKKIDGVDPTKIDAAKDQITF